MGGILMTGGAGFIGSHLADRLIAAGHRVRVLDSLDPQVHGTARRRPDYLHRDVELVVGDVRDKKTVVRALDGMDAVVHLAARVGVGQSMYAIEDYADVNVRGTGVLLEALIERPVRRLVVASSMSIYGEGRYRDEAGDVVDDAARSRAALEAGRWDPTDAAGRPLRPVPTPEDKRPELTSIYALSKFDQERACLLFGAAYALPVVALRFFNVYGTRQALSNPYTGVLAIFASRLLNGNRPKVFEDGEQRRDFVSVHDVADAIVLAMTSEAAVGNVYNVGSGESRSVLEIARTLAQVLGREDLAPELLGKCRIGDIRHCFAAIDAARRDLGYAPKVRLADGLVELVHWLREQSAEDHVEAATEELVARGLTL